MQDLLPAKTPVCGGLANGWYDWVACECNQGLLSWNAVDQVVKKNNSTHIKSMALACPCMVYSMGFKPLQPRIIDCTSCSFVQPKGSKHVNETRVVCLDHAMRRQLYPWLGARVKPAKSQTSQACQSASFLCGRWPEAHGYQAQYTTWFLLYGFGILGMVYRCIGVSHIERSKMWCMSILCLTIQCLHEQKSCAHIFLHIRIVFSIGIYKTIPAFLYMYGNLSITCAFALYSNHWVYTHAKCVWLPGWRTQPSQASWKKDSAWWRLMAPKICLGPGGWEWCGELNVWGAYNSIRL